MPQKRSEPRYMCADLVDVLIRHEDQTVQQAVAQLEDISPSGACLQLDEAVRLGADIEIVCATCRFKGAVRNCRYAGHGYDVGVAFDNPKAWNAGRYQPAHLLPIETGLAYLDAHPDAPQENTPQPAREPNSTDAT